MYMTRNFIIFLRANCFISGAKVALGPCDDKQIKQKQK